MNFWIRQVVAKLLGIPERIDWKACQKSVDEESTDARNFKSAFSGFDFTEQ
jgi:hypothetical protein